MPSIISPVTPLPEIENNVCSPRLMFPEDSPELTEDTFCRKLRHLARARIILLWVATWWSRRRRKPGRVPGPRGRSQGM
jgi:hypothetical protein